MRILVTGFGGFPGARENPTEGMIAALERHRSRLARVGLRLETCMLPVVYEGLERRLAAAVGAVAPEAILHFGLARRRPRICVETRAQNHVSPLRPDAAGARPRRTTILSGAPQTLRSTAPPALIAARLRREGFAADLSSDAGDYLCNRTLFISLARYPRTLVGFIHVAASGVRRKGAKSSRPARVEFADAALACALALAPLLRKHLRQ